MAELQPGTEFAGYRIEGPAGRGGMGVVYRATQRGLERSVALKLIAAEYAADVEFRNRFQRESRLAASIEHPNVIPVYEAGEHEGALFISMRFVDGSDLKSLLQRDGRIEPVRAARIVNQVGAALDAAHARGLVHRDVKPGNVLVTPDEHIYLTDFGLTKRAHSESALTKTGQMVGTVDYVAPEQIEGGAVDARSDVYALGCVLYHLLTGRVPFDKPTEMARLYAHVHEAPPKPSDEIPGLPRELDEVVARAMAKDPDERHPSAGDLGRAALAAAEHRALPSTEQSIARGEAAPGRVESAPTVRGTVAPQPAEAASRSRRPLIAGGVAALVAIVVAAVLLAGGGGEENGGGGGADAGSITSAQARTAGRRFVQGMHDENARAFLALFHNENFEAFMDGDTCSDADQPMDEATTIEELQCIFDDKDDLTMQVSGESFDPDTSNYTAEYMFLDGNEPFRRGEITAHLVAAGQNAAIDRLELTGSFDDPNAAGRTGTVPRADAAALVSRYADYFEDENLGGLEEIATGNFTLIVNGRTCSGSSSPMGPDEAFGEYQCLFDRLELPAMHVSQVQVIPGSPARARARYRLTDGGKAVEAGGLQFEIVPGSQEGDPDIKTLRVTRR